VKRNLSSSDLNALLDWLRFRLDTFPRSPRLQRVVPPDHQALPWLDVPGKRAAGSDSRWEAIAPVLERAGARTALDLGCNVGFFTVKLAQAGIAAVGVESHPTFYRTALYARRQLRLSNVGILVLGLAPETVELLPEVDAVLFLALWHHLVRSHGLDEATSMLETIWARTRVLVFETGENELPGSYGLPPMTPDAGTWLAEFLGRTCEGGDVAHLGMHAAVAPDGSECSRNLFAVVRRTAAGP
jgi:SAM-dependent methyltransferase